MKGNKLIIIILSIILSLVIIASGALFAYMSFNSNDEEKSPSIDEVLENSVDIPEIVTNLSGDDYIRITFKIQAENKKASDELQKRDFQVKNIIIQELSELTADDLRSKEGKNNLEEILKDEINQLMQNGEVVRAYITSAILQ